MKIIYMGKDKPNVIKGLEYLISQKHTIFLVCCKQDGLLWNFCKNNNISMCSDEEIYEKIKDKPDIDIVISFLFWRKIKKPLIELPKLYCLNFHPGPLPECKGLGGYNLALLFNKNYYGVTCHHISESIDDGSIVQKDIFTINPEIDTIFSLEKKSMEYLYVLFINVISKIENNIQLPYIKQQNETWNNVGYISMQKFNELREIKNTDSEELVNRKIRAFFHPPFEGAYIKINNVSYTLVSQELMKNIKI